MELVKYDHKTIEQKYKKNWFENNLYEAVDFSSKPKKYILAELPYPSGKSLHIGHMMRYTVPEIYSRFLRMSGYNVLFPMGWDCFGLPAETFAIKQNTTPQNVILQATIDFKNSMKDMGYAIDWSREISTSDPSYYKWTQWTFKKLFEKGLAIQQKMPVWWCQELGVLADEEVVTASDGTKISERGGYRVEKKPFNQWVLNIPKYAERLIDDLDKTNYKQDVKQGQINWIGKKTGTTIDFFVKSNQYTFVLKAFTTRLDTIFGVTFIAVSPDSLIASELIEKSVNKAELINYVQNSKSLSDLEKQTKEKTGVLMKGINALHPLTNKKIPIYISDYILSDYGTGIVMGVPAHDLRDYEFAKKYNIQIKHVISKNPNKINDHEPFTDEGFLINSEKFNNLISINAKNIILNNLKKLNLASKTTTYKLRPQVFSRQRYWGEPIPLYYDKNNNVKAVKDHELPIELPIMEDFLPSSDGTSPLKRNIEWNKFKDENNNTCYRETDTMPTWAGSNWYYLRYIDPKNNNSIADLEKVKYWMPVDMYFGDSGHTTAHLLYSRFWYKFLYDIKAVPNDEPYDFRMSGGMLLGTDGQKMSKSKGNIVSPHEIINEYGADSLRTYLAFIGPYEDTYPWNPRGLKACYKLIKTIYELKEKIVHIKNYEDVTNSQNSKSYKFSQSDQNNTGTQNDQNDQDSQNNSISHDNEFTIQIITINRCIKNTTQMFNDFKINTVVSEIMICVNELKKCSKVLDSVYKKLILVIAPIMPFIAEELWQLINNTQWSKNNSVHIQSWPSYDESLLNSDHKVIAIQINGKTKGTIKFIVDGTKDDLIEIVKNDDLYKKYFDKSNVKNIVFVKNKIINFVFK